MYYLVQDPANACYVFTALDPRKDGFQGSVQEGIQLEVPADLHHCPQGVTAPAPCLAVSERNSQHYRVFKYRSDCRRAGFRALSALYAVCQTWSDYQAGLQPPS